MVGFGGGVPGPGAAVAGSVGGGRASAVRGAGTAPEGVPLVWEGG